jgi:hypothetical protein
MVMAGSIVLLVLAFSLTGAEGAVLTNVFGLSFLFGWVGLPAAGYYDMQYVRANGSWNPNTLVWIVLLGAIFLNVVAGGVYLYRRHEVLGEP